MKQHDVPVSWYYEVRFFVVGKVVSASCHVIGWFMPYFFAGRLESGNVCEYFVMMKYFQSLGIHGHDEIFCEMGMKEKEREVYFLAQIRTSRWLPYFERVFGWGAQSALNDVDLEKKYPVAASHLYCKTHEVATE